MKLWLLRPVDGLPAGNNPWEPWWDKSFGFVVRAETESEAREIAHAAAGNENDEEFLDAEVENTQEPWRDANYSTCVELLPEGSSGVVMEDFAKS